MIEDEDFPTVDADEVTQDEGEGLGGSTCVLDLDYDKDSRELVVTFVRTGESYVYSDVSPQRVRAFRNADSLGGYFNDRIRNAYAYSKGQ